MKKVNNFQISKVQPQGVALILFDFLSNLKSVHSGAINPYARCDLKFTRSSTIISPYLAKFIKHNQ